MNEQFVASRSTARSGPTSTRSTWTRSSAMTGHGGWPMTVFLHARRRALLRRDVLPAGAAPRPAELPTGARRRRRGVARAARDVARQAAQLTEHVCAARRRDRPSSEPLDDGLLAEAVAAMRRQLRPAWGGFGGAPKFPPASTLEFLSSPRRRAARWRSDDARRDGRRRHVRPRRRRLPPVLGRRATGSCRTSRRCSTTTRCSSPRTCTAWLVSGEDRYREVVEETIDYLLRELGCRGRLRLGAGCGHRAVSRG